MARKNENKTYIPYMRNSHSSLQNFVDFTFIKELRVPGFHLFQFDCNFLRQKNYDSIRE